MANIRYSAMIADARGSIGGVTLSRGRGGAIARNRSKPVNPRSSRQESLRGQTAHLSRYWSKTLTAQQRADWNAYAAGTSWTNKLGDSIQINGNAAFMRLNALLIQAGGALTPAAPLAMGHAGGITISATAENDTSKIQLAEPGGSFDKDLDDDWVLIFQALPAEAGNAAGRKGIRFIGAVEGDSIAAPVFPYEISAAYTMAAGQQITLKAVHIDPDYRVSAPVFFSVLAAPSI